MPGKKGKYEDFFCIGVGVLQWWAGSKHGVKDPIQELGIKHTVYPGISEIWDYKVILQ